MAEVVMDAPLHNGWKIRVESEHGASEVKVCMISGESRREVARYEEGRLKMTPDEGDGLPAHVQIMQIEDEDVLSLLLEADAAERLCRNVLPKDYAGSGEHAMENILKMPLWQKIVDACVMASVMKR